MSSAYRQSAALRHNHTPCQARLSTMAISWFPRRSKTVTSTRDPRERTCRSERALISEKPPVLQLPASPRLCAANPPVLSEGVSVTNTGIRAEVQRATRSRRLNRPVEAGGGRWWVSVQVAVSGLTALWTLLSCVAWMVFMLIPVRRAILRLAIATRSSMSSSLCRFPSLIASLQLNTDLQHYL